MNLGLVIYGSLDQMTGGYRYDHQLVTHLRQQGDRVEIFSLPWQSYLRHLGQNFSRRLDRWIESSGVDLLLEDELNHPSLFLANRRLRRPQLPLVSIVHHLRSSELWRPVALAAYRLVERAYLRSVDAVVCNSRPTLAAAQSLAGRPLRGLIAWPGAHRHQQRVTPDQVAARAYEPGPLRLLYLGAIVPRKGLDVLLQALARLPAGSARLTVVGEAHRDPGYARRMAHRAHQLPLPVAFLGPVPDEQLDGLLASHQVLAIPSQHEGFGIGYLEGMGSGMVCLASASGGASDLVRDGVEGFLIPAGAESLLAEYLGRLHADRALLARMGVAGLERARRHPTWEASAHQIRQFLEQCIRQTASVGAAAGW